MELNTPNFPQTQTESDTDSDGGDETDDTEGEANDGTNGTKFKKRSRPKNSGKRQKCTTHLPPLDTGTATHTMAAAELGEQQWEAEDNPAPLQLKAVVYYSLDEWKEVTNCEQVELTEEQEALC